MSLLWWWHMRSSRIKKLPLPTGEEVDHSPAWRALPTAVYPTVERTTAALLPPGARVIDCGANDHVPDIHLSTLWPPEVKNGRVIEGQVVYPPGEPRQRHGR
jgi:hypothetical protein